MSDPKLLMYDWMGLNLAIFKLINPIKGEWYDKVMAYISMAADHHNFPYYAVAIAAIGLVSYARKKLGNTGGANRCLIMWASVLLVFGASYVVDGGVVKTLKSHFEYPRPYVVLEHESVHTIDLKPDAEDSHHSFPSGHMSFITVLIMSLWPVLSFGVRWFGMFFIAAVGWSRMAMGMHFPADLLYAFLLSILIVTLVRLVLSKIIFKTTGVRC
jgi:membrane-associated phospholipid phosphatase